MNIPNQKLILSQETLRILIEDSSEQSLNTTLPICPTGFDAGKGIR